MKTRVGVVGAGGIAAVHLKNLHENEQAELIAVCDIVPENVRKSAEQYGIRAYTDVDEMLEKEKMDALFLCVPPFAHGEIEEKAAKQGIHLFVEKPLGLDLERVQKKAEVIRQSGILASSGYCLRYLNTAEIAKHYLADKKIAMIRAYYLTSFVGTPWWREMAKSGGQLVEQSTHTVDLVRYLAGDVEKVYADMALLVMDDIDGVTIPDVGCINLKMTSGAIGHVDTTFTQADHRSGVEILGRDFRVWIDGTALTIIDKNQTTNIQSKVDFYKEQDQAFIEAIQTGDRSLIRSSYENGQKTLEVTLAANQSAQTGQPVILTTP